jgi:hypothetical protein
MADVGSADLISKLLSLQHQEVVRSKCNVLYVLCAMYCTFCVQCTVRSVNYVLYVLCAMYYTHGVQSDVNHIRILTPPQSRSRTNKPLY